MMDPMMIRYIDKYKEQKANGQDNPTGIKKEQLKLNDIWNIIFLVLLTHNPRFSYCYSYQITNKLPEVSFNPILFRKLMYKVLLTFESDLNFCFVLSKLCNFDRFKEIGNDVHYFKKKSLNYKQTSFSLRDLRFYIWVLTQSKYPKEKILRFELGETIKEVDLDESIKSDYSICQEVEQSQNFRKTSYYNYKEITTPSLNEKATYNPSDVSRKVIPSFAESKIENQSIHNKKSQFQNNNLNKTVSKKQQSGSNGPVQEFENIPIYNYNNQKNDQLNKTLEKTLTNDSKSKNLENLKKNKKVEDDYSSRDTVSIKVRSRKQNPKKGTWNKANQKVNPENKLDSWKGDKDQSQSGKVRTSKKLLNLNEKKGLLGGGSNQYTVKNKLPPRTITSIEQVISNLKKISLKTKEMTTLQEVDNRNDMIFDMPGSKAGSGIKCPCRLCKKVKLRVPKVAINIKTIFKNEVKLTKNPSEIRKLKYSNRLKKTQKSKGVKLNIVDPYINKKKSTVKKSQKPDLKINKKKFNSNLYCSENSKISVRESKSLKYGF
jgi:hypothetical protein